MEQEKSLRRKPIEPNVNDFVVAVYERKVIVRE